MSMVNYVYSGLDLIMTVDGIHITGVEQVEDAYSIETPERTTIKKNMFGGGAWQVNNDTSLTLKVKLMAVHTDNDIMAALYQTLNLGGAATPALVSLNKNGGDFVMAGTFLIKKAPNMVAGTEAAAMEWELISPGAAFNPGAMGGH